MMMTKVTAETSPEGVMAGLFAAVDVIGRDHFHKSPSPAKFHKSPLTDEHRRGIFPTHSEWAMSSAVTKHPAELQRYWER